MNNAIFHFIAPNIGYIFQTYHLILKENVDKSEIILVIQYF